MTRLIFWDVDTQHDFMRRDGALYVRGAARLIPVLAGLTRFAHNHRIPIVASADNHEPTDPEISDTPDWVTTFPPHCLRGTPGQRKIPETALADPLVIDPEPQDPGALAQRILGHGRDLLPHKRALDVFSNPNMPAVLRALEPETVVIYGVATEFCVRHTVEGLLRHLPRARLVLVSDAVRAIRPAEGERLVASWRERSVQLMESEAILREGSLAAYGAPSAV